MPLHRPVLVTAIAAGLVPAACGCMPLVGGWNRVVDESAVPESARLVSVRVTGATRSPNRNLWHHGARDQDYPAPSWNHAESVTFNFNAEYRVPFYLGLAFATEPLSSDYNASQQLLSVIYGAQLYKSFVTRARRVTLDARAHYEQRNRSGAQQNAQLYRFQAGYDAPWLARAVGAAVSWFMPVDVARYRRRPEDLNLLQFAVQAQRFGYDSLTWHRLPGRPGAPQDAPESFFHPGRSLGAELSLDLSAVSRWPWLLLARETWHAPGASVSQWTPRAVTDELFVGYRNAVGESVSWILLASVAHHRGAATDRLVGRLTAVLTMGVELKRRVPQNGSGGS